jgi:hypothetical protein
VDSQ